MEDGRHGGIVSKYNGKFKPFGKHSTLLSTLLHEIRPVLQDGRFFRIIWLGIINLSCLIILVSWCHSTKSIGLECFTNLVFFDTLSLIICSFRIWVEQKKPNQQYTYGYERVEVLAIFLSATFSLFFSIQLMKKSLERWLFTSDVVIGHFTSGVLVAFLCHMLMTYCTRNKGLNLVVCASSMALFQKRLSSLSQNFCTNMPGLTKASLRFNPFVVIGWASCAILILAQFIIDTYEYRFADNFAALCVALMTCVIMYPLCGYSGKILLQGTPPHIADLLNKSLREASTLEGVLEFRNEHFWLLGYDKIVGSVHVRIRRDANEQAVLGHIMEKLSSLVPDITIQVFKDEWAWSSSTLQILNESFKKFPPSSSYQAPSDFKTSSNVKSSLGSYSSTSTSSYTKSSGMESKSSFKQQYSPESMVSPAIPRLNPLDVCSVDISNIENSSDNVPSTSSHRHSHVINVPRMSRTEYHSIDHLSQETVDNDFVKVYKS